MNIENIKKWEETLKKITDLHKKIKHIDTSLEYLYPVAIVENNIFYVFDYNASADKYDFIIEYSIPGFEMPEKILASFPLDFYNNKPAAVVSEDAIYDIEKQVFIFHEFVHCYQFLNEEMNIKATLEIYKKYINENNQMWEITHAFQYNDVVFTEKATELVKNYNESNNNAIIEFYNYMKTYLSNIDYEYLIWQEFKEGYARFVENNIRAFLDLELNSTTPQAPFKRSVFYWTGSRHIDFLINTQGKPFNSFADLFALMY